MASINLLPVFLWKKIIPMLSYDDVCKLNQVNNTFVRVTSEIIFKQKFMNIDKPFVVVKWCSEIKICPDDKDYWKYSYENHVTFDDFVVTLTSICGYNTFRDNKSTLIQFKMYCNDYDNNNIPDEINVENMIYNFSTARCSLEIIGVENKYCHFTYEGCEDYPFVISGIESFSMTNIYLSLGILRIISDDINNSIFLENCTFVSTKIEINTKGYALLRHNIFEFGYIKINEDVDLDLPELYHASNIISKDILSDIKSDRIKCVGNKLINIDEIKKIKGPK